MKRDERKDDFLQNVSEPSNPPDELAQHVSKQNHRRTNLSSIFCKSSESGRISIIYVIPIRFYGPRELNQKGVRRARYEENSRVTRKTSDDELIQHDNKMRNWDTKWKIQKSGKSRIVHGLVTKHDTNTNDNNNDCVALHDANTNDHFH